MNIGNENHKQVVERIKTNPNETQLLVVDRQTDAYYKDKKVVIKGTMSNVLYLKTPTVEEEEKMIGKVLRALAMQWKLVSREYMRCVCCGVSRCRSWFFFQMSTLKNCVLLFGYDFGMTDRRTRHHVEIRSASFSRTDMLFCWSLAASLCRHSQFQIYLSSIPVSTVIMIFLPLLQITCQNASQ